jgi:hypothetical protein
MTMEELHTRTQALLGRESVPPPLPVTAEGELELFAPPSPGQRFLPFLPAHLQHALSLSARFMELANERPGAAGLAAVLDEAERQAREDDQERVRYALRVFITHHPEGRRLPLPPLRERAPHQVLPSRRNSTGMESALDYFREDTGLGESYDTWSVVSPAAGYPDPARPRQRLTSERRGERFWHLHQQLLARYDTERLAFGHPRVVPLSDYASPIPEGYDAGLPGFAPRPPGASPRSLPGYGITDHATRRDRLFTAASSGLLWQGDSPLTLESVGQLADTAESNVGSVDGEAWAEPLGHYGSLHNLGHVLLAHLLPPARAALPGVMASPATAVRDPVFYRWHRHVDDILDAWQRTHLPPHELSAGPRVRMRHWLGGGRAPAHQSPDILVCLRRDIPEAGAPDFDGQRWGEATFGGEHWDIPPPSFSMTTHSLRTRLGREELRLPEGRLVDKPRLEHAEFCYFLRVENLLPREQEVTVRLFLVADAFAEERRLWLEMERFEHTLRPSERAVLFRSSRAASVVREGWPAHLLLPRGRSEGMLFRLMVMLTHPEQEGSEELGYPFNRPFPPGRRLAELLAGHPHVATRNLFIHHEP